MVDSNIFTYFLLKDAVYFSSCNKFLRKIEYGDCIGFIDGIVIAETLFNFVKWGVVKAYKINARDFISFIKKEPEVIGKVDISEVDEIFSITNLNLVNVPSKNIRSMLKDVHARSLLSNDAFHLLTMTYLGIENIATNDTDFERVEGIKVWKP
ncbi:MAG: PIN domain-containing protein [Candidatus Hydrothermarchaeota archaeon]|nr:PIN domain-containing protein [Candidatus Hydrothermarchaeota archaeon]